MPEDMIPEEQQELYLAYSAIEEYNRIYELGGEMPYPFEAEAIIRKYEKMEAV